MKQQELVNEARDLLAQFVAKTESASLNNLLDINHISEQLVLNLLRIAWDMPQLRSLNATERANFPGIDLADERCRIAIQVTATPTLAKLRDTIQTFLRHDLEQRYTRLVFVVITRKQGRYSSEKLNELCGDRLAFLAIRDVIDHTDLLRDAVNLDPARLAAFVQCLRDFTFGAGRPNGARGRGRGKRASDFTQVIRPAPPFQAPALPPHYVPREKEWNEIIRSVTSEAAESHAGVLPVTLLHGPGGIGKSTLAAAVAHSPEVRAHFPDGVFWARLGTHPDRLSLLNSWVAATGEHFADQLSEHDATNYLRSILRDRAALMIVDDVWDQQSLQPFLVGGAQCHVLVTARRMQVGDQVGGTALLLPEMTPEESLELIVAKAIKPGSAHTLTAAERIEAAALVDDLGRLPLALELVGAQVARGGSWSEVRRNFLEELAKSPAESDYATRAMQKIETCLTLSLRVLRQEHTGAWSAFIWLSLLPPEHRISIQMAANIWNLKAVDARTVLSILAEDALLKRIGEQYVVHSLMHWVAGKRLRGQAPEGLGLSLQEGHTAVVENYRTQVTDGRWDRLPDDGYIHGRLIWHLEQAGNIEEIFRLLSTEDEKGRNAWFVRREQLGQLGGYVQDLRVAMKLSRTGERRPSSQILWALAISSIASATVNFTPEVIEALVTSGAWSTTRAFQWIENVCPYERRVEFLIQFARTISSLPLDIDLRQTKRLRLQAQEMARVQLVSRGPTAVAIQRMSKLLQTLDPEELQRAVLPTMTWCAEAGARLKLLRLLPAELRTTFLSGINDKVLALGEREKVILLARIIPLLAVGDRARYFQLLLDTIDRLGYKALNPPKSDFGSRIREKLQDTLLRRAEGEAAPSSADTKALSVPAEDDVLLPPDESDLGPMLRDALIHVPRELRAQADATVRKVRDKRLSRELQQSLELSKRSPGVAAGLSREDQIDSLIERRLIPHAIELILQRPLDMERRLENAVSLLCESHVEWACGELAQLLFTLPPESRYRIGNIMRERNRAALGPRLLVWSGTRDTAQIPALRQEFGKVRELTAAQVLCCIYHGPESLVADALQRYSVISDRTEAAGAMLALLPYLPRSFPKDLFAELNDKSLAGPQIAGVTEMMLKLSSALDAGVLPEVIDSVSKLESEWWIVEALSVALMRLRRSEDIEAILSAAPTIRNLDLRARLVGRVAVRLCDLGFAGMAISAATSIELESSRWQALRELAKRFSSIGDLQHAEIAASRIASSEYCSSAYFDAALEMGSQGRFEEAGMLVRKISSREWRQTAEQLLGRSVGAMQMVQSRLDERVALRRQDEGAVSEYSTILRGLERSPSLLKREDIAAIRIAVQASDADGVRSAVHRLWSRELSDDESLIGYLSKQMRPQFLSMFMTLAPLLGAGERWEALDTVRAIRNVRRWWP